MKAMTLLSVMAVLLLGAVVASPSSLMATVYVVDNANPVASDENPGTSDKPWKTVGHAAGAAKGGDTVCVMEGVYDETLSATNSGRPGAPIIFRGLPRHTAQLKGADAGKASYVRIEGFHFAGGGVSVGGDHIWIVDNTFDKVRGTTVGGSGSNITVAYNRSKDPSCGVFASGQNWMVEANDIEHMVYQTGECDYGRFFGRGHTFRRNYFHGTAQADVRKSHVDGFQTYNLKARANLQAHDMTFVDNVVYNFHQAIIARSADAGFLSNFTIRGNIFAHGLLPNEKGAAVGLIFENVPGVLVEHNLIADVQWFGFSPSKTTAGTVRNNIIYKVGSFDRGHRPEGWKLDHNIATGTKTKLPAEAVVQTDPKFVDPEKDNWRLKPDSPAIGKGAGGATIGPFAWPNVYAVDARHPGASDEAGLGHPGRPMKTITHALKIAKPGETIVVYGGTYRECPVAMADNVTVKAAEGCSPIVSGADLVTDWTREGSGWSAPLGEAPKTVLRNGRPTKGVTYDAKAKRLRVAGGDPRLAVYEVVVREHAINLSGKRVRLENIAAGSTGGEAVAGAGNATVVRGK